MKETDLKVGGIGAGAVASTTRLSMVMRGDAREIAVVTDLQYGAPLYSGLTIRDRDFRI